MSELISKWHMHRLGLVDFWYYVNEEFPFKDGHMLLRGSNGSGKSVTMQSFIPLLLDGNKSSERLDPFGTLEIQTHQLIHILYLQPALRLVLMELRINLRFQQVLTVIYLR